MIRIVKAGEEDRGAVLALVEKLLRELEEKPEEFAGIDREKVVRDLEEAAERFTAFLAVDDAGIPVGAVTVVETFAIYAGGNYGVIDEMVVEPGHRSRGIGRLLIEAVKEHGRRRGWARVDVTAPPGKTWERTVRFYEAQGFVFTGPKLRYRLRGDGP